MIPTRCSSSLEAGPIGQVTWICCRSVDTCFVASAASSIVTRKSCTTLVGISFAGWGVFCLHKTSLNSSSSHTSRCHQNHEDVVFFINLQFPVDPNLIVQFRKVSNVRSTNYRCNHTQEACTFSITRTKWRDLRFDVPPLKFSTGILQSLESLQKVWKCPCFGASPFNAAVWGDLQTVPVIVFEQKCGSYSFYQRALS